jgi:hypothetical protein
MKWLMDGRLVVVARWAGRALSVLLLWLAIVLVVGHIRGSCRGNDVARPAPAAGTAVHLRETSLGICLLAIVTGLAIGWRWEGLGGLLIVAGNVVFALINGRFSFVPNPISNPLFASLIVGLLFLFCWWRGRSSGPRIEDGECRPT